MDFLRDAKPGFLYTYGKEYIVCNKIHTCGIPYFRTFPDLKAMGNCGQNHTQILIAKNVPYGKKHRVKTQAAIERFQQEHPELFI